MPQNAGRPKGVRNRRLLLQEAEEALGKARTGEADPTSLEQFGRMVDKIPTLRVLLIVTFRPEFESPGSDGPL